MLFAPRDDEDAIRSAQARKQHILIAVAERHAQAPQLFLALNFLNDFLAPLKFTAQ